MTRRTALDWLAAAAGVLRLPALRAWAQTAGFPGEHAATLRELAAVVLPASLGRPAIVQVAARFEQWVRDYRPGAEMEHGYGVTRIRFQPSSPAAAYREQLSALKASLGGDPDAKRKAVAAALTQAGIDALPRLPDGKHIVSDLISFYFHSGQGYDLCYGAAIERDRCRGLDGSDNPPPPLKGAA